MKIRRPFALLCAAAFSATAHAKVFDDARVAAPFVKIGEGARASGMGEAFTAVADDSTAVFWNPAGLAQVNVVEAQFSHNQWLGDFRQEYFGLTAPYGGTWALAYSLLDLGDFSSVNSANVSQGHTFQVNDQVLMAGFGRGYFNESVLVGASAKVIKEDLGDGVGGRAASLDVGMMAIPIWENPRLSFGAVVENMGSELAGFALPLTVRGGVALRKTGLIFPAPSAGSADAVDPIAAEGRKTSRYPWQFMEGVDDSLTLAADFAIPTQGRVEVHGGVEYWIAVVALRVGYRYRFPRNELGGPSGMTLGMGLRGRGFQFDYGFDYSFAPYGDLGDASRFSVMISF